MVKLTNPDDMPTLVMSDSQDLEAFYAMQARLMFFMINVFQYITYMFFCLFEGLTTRYSFLELARGRSSCGRPIYSPSSVQGHNIFF